MKDEEAHAAGCLVNLGRLIVLLYNSHKMFSFPELKIRIQLLIQEDTASKNHLISLKRFSR